MVNIEKDTQVIFLGNPVAEDAVESSGVYDANIADNIAQNSVIRGLYKEYKDKLTVISVSPNKNRTSIDLGYGIKAQTIYCNSRNAITYYLSVMVGYIGKLGKIMKTMRHEDVLVVTNGPYIYRALAVILCKWRYKNVIWVPFLVGAVEVPEAKFPFSLVSKMSRWTVKMADGAITYVAKSVEDYMPGKPYIEIVYLVGDTLMKSYHDNQSKKHKKFTVSYTGALTSIYNIDTIIEVIKKTGNTYRWVFAGVGQYEDEIKTLAHDKHYDVEYLGRVSNVEAVEVQKSSHLLLCVKGGDRSEVNQYYSKYAASGKLTEYLCSGTPVLASDIPAFSQTVRPFATFDNNQTTDRIIESLLYIKDHYEDKVLQAKKGQDYAFKYFNAHYQNKRIYSFLDSLIESRTNNK